MKEVNCEHNDDFERVCVSLLICSADEAQTGEVEQEGAQDELADRLLV